ncbi:hypothetical protein IFM89_018234, partial [Coptis chinensis]
HTSHVTHSLPDRQFWIPLKKIWLSRFHSSEKMMKAHLLLHLLLLPLFFLILFADSKDPLGVSPDDIKYFNSEIIKCKDGSKKFTKAQLNDNFCDCPDGTDEPGTSACPGGKFYCRNAGHAPVLLFSSRVNDGICDCCDGSDEYDGRTNCTNTCWDAGKKARDKLKKKIATYQEGVTIRNRDVEQAKHAIAKDEAELSKLKEEEKILKKLVQQLKERKEQIEKAEEKERLEQEKEEKRKHESEEKGDVETKHTTEKKHEEGDDSIGVLDDPPVEQEPDDKDNIIVEAETGHDDESKLSSSDSVKQESDDKDNIMVEAETGHDDESKSSSGDSGKQEKDESESTAELSKEELGRLVASRWTGENVEQKTKDVNDAKLEEHEETSNTTTASNPSWLDKIQDTVRNIFQSVNIFQTPIDKSEASHIKKEYEDSSSKLSKIQSRISSLKEKLKHDVGTEKEFYSFYDRCFENKQNKYVYKVCPFKQASQVEGHSKTQLGHWEKFEDSYRFMVFSNGDKCWNGPDRSLKVKLRCGLTNELTDVDEPSRCEYVALLSTPALCLDERLKELQHKLDLMNLEQPQSHDEL